MNVRYCSTRKMPTLQHSVKTVTDTIDIEINEGFLDKIIFGSFYGKKSPLTIRILPFSWNKYFSDNFKVIGETQNRKMDKENCQSTSHPCDIDNKRKSYRRANVYVKSRNVLGDLQNNVVTSRKIVKSTSLVVRTKVNRSKSDSGPTETKLEYYLKTEKITEREDEDQKVCAIDEVFESGVDHHVTRDVHVPRVVSKSDGTTDIAEPLKGATNLREAKKIKQPAQKVNLLSQINRRKKHFNEDALYKDCLYNEEYFEGNYQYMVQLENDFVYRKDVLKSYIDESYRMIVVNWLNHVNFKLGLSEETFFKSVRMFDYITATCKIPNKKYTLIALTCMWIVNKYSDIYFIRAPKLSTVCNERFSPQEFISAEKEILRILSFNISFPEPISFLFYYLNKLELVNDSKVRFSAMFVMEVFTVLLEYSSTAPSILAAIALYNVLLKNELDSSSFLEFIRTHLLPEHVFVQKSRYLNEATTAVLDNKLGCDEIISKYSTPDRLYVARYFLSP